MYATVKINNTGPFYILAPKNLTVLGFAQQLASNSAKIEALGFNVVFQGIVKDIPADDVSLEMKARLGELFLKLFTQSS